ncbi:thiamine ABC transporter substrate binding subunit [Marinomonas mediterranea]|jgi:thiamine ABC transporter, periplasmic binding protein|uniref:Thiamine-binding periplasmic protein n=1 Tax=Marinomonas mediterranea (strain ATCC 700492 / JCM 21426 / NBRC 103028 / MMB-1) TaxID=717774 RepID=F2K3P3_MARM1|nr:thiamine ABC transporter substrate binding subunit [Marinomonas mediterranea]ADZ92482.1 thiamine ABC transporter, periplasmic binding protein [Marinomonas mediterranea MMB-1]WCN18527.1 thiamine ABC transporter substrate binding subunit [Marinomonas mediterranea MMB-1]
MSFKKTLLTAFSASVMLVTASSAVAASTLNVYTYDSFASDWGPGPKIKTKFEAQCDCTLNYVTLDSSVGILSRVQLEGLSSSADVVLGLDLNVMEAAKKTGLLAEHAVDTSNVNVAGGWSDKYFVPFDQGYFAFIYNSEAMAQPPKSLKEVVENKDLRVIYQDPRTSTPGLGLLLWMKSVYGDSADQAWETLASHTVTVTKGWYDAYSLFLKGEADVVLSYTTSPAYHVVAEGETKYKAAPASEGFYPQVEVAATLKNAPNKALAQQFMSFILTSEFQNTVATGNWMLPVIDDVNELPEIFSQLQQPTKVLTLPANDVAEHRKAWINEWLNATTR